MRIRLRSISSISRLAILVAGLAAVTSAVAGPPAPAPRTLILVLDGVPHRVVERVVADGAFADWAPPARLIAPFPSMTNPSLTLLLSPLGVAPAPGYELQHYDWATNSVHGGGAFEYKDGVFPWRSHVQVPLRSLPGKFGTYTHPRRHFEADLEWAEKVVLEDQRDVVIVHVGALDALQHIKGDDTVIPLVRSLDAWTKGLAERHLAARGRPLRFVMLSDHGNSDQKIRRLFNGRAQLEGSGLRVRRTLEQPGDVVVGTFGVNGYAPLYTDAAHAESAARAMTEHQGVDLAAWRTGPLEIRVLSEDGDAVVRWSQAPPACRYGYEPRSGDPLALADILARLRSEGRSLARLRSEGRVGEDGLAAEEDWLAATATAAYPDALARLVDGLTGAHVVNRATVLLSLEPGWAWGWKSAAFFAWFRGGALEGTHGGLDHDSSVGFLLASDPSLVAAPVMRSVEALAPALAR